MPGLACGNHHKRVIGGRIAIHGDTVERHIGEPAGQCAHQLWGHTGVGGQKTEHGCHVGADHARPFRNTGGTHRGAAQHELTACSLGQRVGGHHAFSGRQPLGTRCHRRLRCEFKRLGQTRQEPVQGQRLHDHPGGKRQHLLMTQPERTRHGRAGLARRSQSWLARAGVRVAGVDDHGTNGSTRGQVLTAHLHRCSRIAVLGENRTHRTAFVQKENGQIFAVGLSDARLSHTNAYTGDGQQINSQRDIKLNRHGNSVKKTWLAVGHPNGSAAGYQSSLPWQCLYFLPLPQGHASLRPTRGTASAKAPEAVATAPALVMTSTSPVSVGAV